MLPLDTPATMDKAAAKKCRNLVNYMMCYFCDPNQADWYITWVQSLLTSPVVVYHMSTESAHLTGGGISREYRVISPVVVYHTSTESAHLTGGGISREYRVTSPVVVYHTSTESAVGAGVITNVKRLQEKPP